MSRSLVARVSRANHYASTPLLSRPPFLVAPTRSLTSDRRAPAARNFCESSIASQLRSQDTRRESHLTSVDSSPYGRSAAPSRAAGESLKPALEFARINIAPTLGRDVSGDHSPILGGRTTRRPCSTAAATPLYRRDPP